MAQSSEIEWTDATWNPVTGCTKIGPGCDNCYAERFAERSHVNRLHDVGELPVQARGVVEADEVGADDQQRDDGQDRESLVDRGVDLVGRRPVLVPHEPLQGDLLARP